MNNACIICNNCGIQLKFGANVAYAKPIPHAKQNSEISTDVIDNDIIMSKLEHFHCKALNFKTLYLSSLWMKLCNLTGLMLLLRHR